MPREDSSYNFHDSERERDWSASGPVVHGGGGVWNKNEKKEVISVIIALGLITNDPPRTSIAGQIKN